MDGEGGRISERMSECEKEYDPRNILGKREREVGRKGGRERLKLAHINNLAHAHPCRNRQKLTNPNP